MNLDGDRPDSGRRQNAAELTILYQVLRAASSSLNLEDVCDRVVRTLAEMGGYSIVNAYFKEGERFHVRAAVGYPHTPEVIDESSGVHGRVVRTGEPQFIRDVSQDPDYMALRPDLTAEICVPIKVDGELVGTLNIESTAARPLTDDDFQLMLALSDQMSLVMRNALLHQAALTANEALRDSERRYRLIADNATDMISTHTSEGIYLYAAPACRALFGYEPEELVGHSAYEFVHPEDRELLKAAHPLVLSQAEPVTISFRVRCKDGHYVWLETTTRGVCDPETGALEEIVAVSRDVSARKQAEAQRDEQRLMLETLLHTTPDVVIFKDRDSVFLGCSRTKGAQHGKTKEEMVGTTDFDFFQPEDAQRFREEEIRVVEKGELIVAEHLVDTIYGQRWFEAIKTPLRNTQGEIVGLLCAERDVTERKRAEEALARYARGMAALYETSLEINAQQDLPALLQAIVRRAVDLVGVRMGGLYLVRPDGESLELVISHNHPRDYTGTVLRFGEGLSGRIAQTGEPMQVADHQSWGGRAVAYADSPFRRVLGVPLKLRDKVVGVINLTDDESTCPFDEDEVRLVSLFADQATIAIENARLYEAAQRELAERKRVEVALRRERDFTASVLNTADTLMNALDPEGRIVMFNRKCQEVSGYTEEEALGRVLWEFLIPPEDVERVRRALGSWPDYEPPSYHENPWLTKDGHRIPLVWTNSTLRDEATGQVLFIGSGLDISERVAHEREIERRNQELTSLYAVLRAASTSLDPAEVCDRVVQTLSEVGGYPLVAVCIKEGERFQIHGTLKLGVLAPDPYTGVHGRVLRTGEAQFIRDVRQDIDYVPAMEGITTEICVPIKMDGEIVGLLDIESTADRPLTDDDFQLMLALRDQMSLVIRNALLHRDLKVERDHVTSINEQLLALQQVATAVSSRLDVQDLLDFIARSATELLGGNSGSILLLNDDGTLTVHGSWGLTPSTRRETRHRLGQSITGIVAQTGRPLIVNDVTADPRFDNDAAAVEGFLSMISMPLVMGKVIVGTLNVHSSTRRQAFDEDHLQVLSLLSNQAVVAIENARLYAATAESELRYRSLFEGNLDGIVLVDADTGRIVGANPAYQKMVGYSLAELEKRAIWELRAPHHQETARRQWLEHVAKGQARGRLLPYQAKDGRAVEAEFVSHVIELGGRRIEVASVRDVTETHQLQEQLRQSQKMEAVGTLAGGIAHDFNNILGAILGYASFVKGTLGADDSRRADLETIERSARRGADLTSQLLTFARGGPHQVKPINLNTTVKEVVQLLSRTVDKSIAIRPMLGKEAVVVEGDTGQVQQLLLNLCLNACEAMPAGGFLTIETQLVHLDAEQAHRELGKEQGDYALLIVSDTGYGMDAETQQRIFEPFFSTKKDHPGKKHSGLGLAMVFGIVRGHNGIIRVESELGRGTTFRIWLPAQVEQEVAEEELPEATVQGGSEIVLVVDDEEPLRELLGRVLAQAGYRVLVADSGMRALDIFRNHTEKIDLVILDMIMPGLNGLQTYQQLRAANPEVCVLASSGYAEEGQAQEVLSLGAKGFLPKPFTLQEMLRTVRIVLDEHYK